MRRNTIILSIESIKLINKVANKINIFSIILTNNILPYFATLIISLLANMSAAGNHCIRCPSFEYATSRKQIKNLIGTIVFGILLQIISIFACSKSLKNNPPLYTKMFGNFLVSMIAGVLTGAYAGGFLGYNGVVAMKKFVIGVNNKSNKHKNE